MNEILFTPWEGNDERPLPPLEAVGGKGHSLYWLAIHGFPVPPTWVLSTAAFELALQRAGLREPIAEIERTILSLENDWAASQEALEALEPLRQQVAAALQRVALPDQVGRALEKLVLMPTQWAVRSSATAEDSLRHSFAGQFLSLLSVPSGITLWEAVRQVWASTFGQKALTYCAQNRIPLPKMAVILQPMSPITAQDRSGVIFSHSPVPTLPGVLIQVAFGTGEVVVGGYGGDLYSVQGDEVRVQPMPTTHIQVTGSGGYTMRATTPPGPALTEAEARQLATLALRVSERWGGPVNIEFVWRADQDPILVQVRPAK